MKKLLSIYLILFSFVVFSQEKQNTLPSILIKDINGKQFNTEDIKNEGKPIVVSFWATWCKPCVKELTAVADLYDEWKEEAGVKIYIVSIDDSRSMSRVAPFVNGKGWEFETLLDPNGDFKRAMNVINVPHTFLINNDGKIVDQHTTYADGDELKLFEKIKKVSKGESIE